MALVVDRRLRNSRRATRRPTMDRTSAMPGAARCRRSDTRSARRSWVDRHLPTRPQQVRTAIPWRLTAPRPGPCSRFLQETRPRPFAQASATPASTAKRPIDGLFAEADLQPIGLARLRQHRSADHQAQLSDRPTDRERQRVDHPSQRFRDDHLRSAPAQLVAGAAAQPDRKLEPGGRAAERCSSSVTR